MSMEHELKIGRCKADLWRGGICHSLEVAPLRRYRSYGAGCCNQSSAKNEASWTMEKGDEKSNAVFL